ncbi:hypothetical protein DGG96_19255 [Legionella qingyii]|uniref:Uncharacterized protein n=1 Tax=Legionella qingyii TaxID=2184757 RepID=A0A317U0W4_9GAMM|nr:hypothetical protein DGG96_19255 [Legionella qingyii]
MKVTVTYSMVVVTSSVSEINKIVVVIIFSLKEIGLEVSFMDEEGLCLFNFTERVEKEVQEIWSKRGV